MENVSMPSSLFFSFHLLLRLLQYIDIDMAQSKAKQKQQFPFNDDNTPARNRI
jgi:hypothetical protein